MNETQERGNLVKRPTIRNLQTLAPSVLGRYTETAPKETRTPHVRAMEKLRGPANTQKGLKEVKKRQVLALYQPDALLYERHFLMCAYGSVHFI